MDINFEPKNQANSRIVKSATATALERLGLSCLASSTNISRILQKKIKRTLVLWAARVRCKKSSFPG